MDSTRHVVEWIFASIHFGKCGQIWRRNFQGFGCWTAAFAVHPVTDSAIFLVHLWARGGRNGFDRDVLYLLLLRNAKDGPRGQEHNEGKDTASSHCVPLSDVQNSPQGVSHLNGRELLFGEANQLHHHCHVSQLRWLEKITLEQVDDSQVGTAGFLPGRTLPYLFVAKAGT